MTTPQEINGSLYSFPIKTIRGEPTTLAPYRGKVLLIVNVASECGFTSQYEGLQRLYLKLKDQGLVVLGFPCNQFGAQEPGDDAAIAGFCEARFQVTFPMFSKIDVNGDSADPLYRYLKKECKGLLGTEGIKWNFTKFLVSRQGEVLARFAPTTTPDALEKQVAPLLA